MGWKGTLRSIEAAIHRAEREARRQQRELQKQQRLLEKMLEAERAAFEVRVHENYLDVLMSIHKECGSHWDWTSIKNSEPPQKPFKSNLFESSAKASIDTFKPGIIDQLLMRVDNKREQFVKTVLEAQRKDEVEYQEALRKYEQELDEWGKITELAGRILAGESEAHLEAIKQIDPFSEISQLGSLVSFQFENNLLKATLYVNDEEVIPSESKTLLKSGKLSVKKMTKTRFYELYQDYVCGTTLRIARELFALLPIEMVLITAIGNLLNTQSGHMEEQPILSVAIPRKTLDSLNFDRIDPSDSMDNFIHQMNFKRAKGFVMVERISSYQFGKKTSIDPIFEPEMA